MSPRAFVLAASLVATLLAPVMASAQTGSPVSEAGASPVALYEALLATPFPQALVPEGVAGLETFEWRDSNDADLAGAVGGVIFAEGDPFGSETPPAVAYIVYPEPSGAQAMLASVTESEESSELAIGDQPLQAVLLDSSDFVGVFSVEGSVLVYGTVPAGSGEAGVRLATALAEAGVTHLRQLAASGAAAIATPGALPLAGEDAYLAMAAAAFPATDLPVEAGRIVVLPEPGAASEAATGLIGSLLVRDADRIAPYPLAFYRFYADEAAATAYVAGEVRRGGVSARYDGPPWTDTPYPTTTIADPRGNSRVLVQVGATVVIGNAVGSAVEQRQAEAMALAEIAVRHLEDVTGLDDRTGGIWLDNAAGGQDRSPVEVYETLLAARFPEELLPEGVGPLETRIWDDPDEPVLAEAVGGVAFSTGDDDPAGDVLTIAYAVFPDSGAAEAAFAGVESIARTNSSRDAMPCVDDELPSVLFDLEVLVVCYARVNDVLVSGMVFTLDAASVDAAGQATSLAQAGIAFLRQAVDSGPAR